MTPFRIAVEKGTKSDFLVTVINNNVFDKYVDLEKYKDRVIF